jgi:hypothetical protein
MANVKISDLTGAAATTAGQEFEVNDALTSKKVTASQVSSFVLSNLSSADLVTLGVTASAAELNILDGVTSTTAELNILDGVTASTAEINHLVGVTSPIQTQIDNATPFTPTTVTGTTPSLNVGSFNFFTQGELSGDTTVTFTSVPTGAKWAYNFEPGREGEWDISSASFLQLFSIAAQDTNAQGIFFKPDGTKMYVVGKTGDNVYEYNLSTAWDISSASFLQSFSVASQDTSPTAIFFKPDGAKMYVVGDIGNDVNEYNLSTPWDISSASFLQLFSVASEDPAPSAIFFKPDGTKMYVVGQTGGEVNEYNLSTAWDISSASFLQLFSIAAQETIATGLFFKPDGSKMYVLGFAGDDVNEYNLSTPWNISTASFLQLFSVASEDTGPTGLFFKPDGSKMYVVGDAGDDVNEYSIGTDFTLTLPTAVQNPPTEVTPFGSLVTYDFYTTDGGTNVYLIGEEVL